MDEKLHILIVEDAPLSVKLIEQTLRKDGIEFDSKSVDTRDAFLKELRESPPDIIISDYYLPQFDGMSALQLAKEHVPDIPFLIITGSINEEVAVVCMKAGADDYILKDRLGRLGLAVKSALEKKWADKQKKLAEQEVLMSSRQWEKTFDTIRDSIFLLDKEFKIIKCNRAFLDFIERPSSDVMGRFCWEVVHGTSSPLEGCPGICVKDSMCRKTMAFQKNDKFFEAIVDPITEDGVFCGSVHILSNITERKCAEKKLQDSEEKVRALLNAPTDAVALLDLKGIIIEANETLVQRFHRSRDDIIGSCVWDLFPLEVATRRKRYIKKVIQSGTPLRFEDEHQGMWFDNVLYPIFNTQGNIEKVAVIAREMTHQKRAEALLKESEQKFRNLAEQSPNMILLKLK